MNPLFVKLVVDIKECIHNNIMNRFIVQSISKLNQSEEIIFLIFPHNALLTFLLLLPMLALVSFLTFWLICHSRQLGFDIIVKVHEQNLELIYKVWDIYSKDTDKEWR